MQIKKNGKRSITKEGRTRVPLYIEFKRKMFNIQHLI